ncbi:hypothetical protein [Modestobacter sp. SSW1-42]|uniref:hypothetical protein n=1 Tax=Modestobacter sp. SSW1-42 TaxID=596372 RepID=UPI003988119E
MRGTAAPSLARGLLGSTVGPLLAGVLDLGRRGREVLAVQGRTVRSALDRSTDDVLRFLVLRVVDVLVSTVDLTDLVRQHVDLDALAAEVDVEALVRRVDLAAVVARIDPDEVVARIDLDAVVARVDLDEAATRLDLERLVARVDPDRVVERVDLDAAVARLDLVALAREVVDGIDLPEIIRSSTGTLATDAVRSVRSETRRADDAVAGLVDRLLGRSPVSSAPVLP